MHQGHECHACLRRMAQQANRFAAAGTEAEERIDARVVRLLEQMEADRTPPEMAWQVLRIVTEETGDPDPFAAVKHEYNRRALDLLPDLQRKVEQADEPLKTAVRLSVAGNIIDFGALREIDLEGTIRRALTEELAIDQMDRLVERLRDARNIVYLTDNSGEIVFDRLLLRTVIDGRVRGSNGPGLERIEILVKGSPILNDAMLEDAREVGLDRLPGVVLRELAVGPGSPGIDPDGAEFADLLAGADLVISKGQGNFENFSELAGLFFLFMAKCPPVARYLEVPEGSLIVYGT